MPFDILLIFIHNDNIRSKKLLEKLSFKYDRENTIDSKLYSKFILTNL